MTIQNNNNNKGLCPSQLWSFGPIIASLKCPAVEQASNTIRKQFATPWQLCHYSTSGHILPDGLHYIIQGPVLGMTTDVFNPPTVFIISSGAMKTGQPGGKLPSWIESFIPPHPAARMCLPGDFWQLQFPKATIFFLNWGFLGARCKKSKMLVANLRNWCF